MARRAIELDAIDVAVDMETPDKMAKIGDDHVGMMVGRSIRIEVMGVHFHQFS